MNRIVVFHLTAALLCCVVVDAQTSSAVDLAELFFPSTMASLPGVAEDRHYSAVDADLDRTGNPDYVIAVYSNGTVARLRVIRRTPAGPELAAEPVFPDLGESNPRIKLVDVDADHRPEIVVSMDAGRGKRQTWIYKWTGSALTSLNPPAIRPRNSEDKSSLFEDSSLYDIDGDGILEYLEPGEGYGAGAESGFIDAGFEMYSLRDGEFRETGRSVPFFALFVRHGGKPVWQSGAFAAEPGDYTLRMATGQDGTPVVDAAVVKLNGTVVARPSDFDGKTRGVDIPVTLKAQNVIQVELRSKPGSALNVAIVRPR